MQAITNVNNPKMQYREKVGVLQHVNYKISQITVLT